MNKPKKTYYHPHNEKCNIVTFYLGLITLIIIGAIIYFYYKD